MSKDINPEDVANVLREEYKVVTVNIPKKAYVFITEALGREDLYEDTGFFTRMARVIVPVDGELSLLLEVVNGNNNYDTPLVEVSLVLPLDFDDEYMDVDTKIYTQLPLPYGIELSGKTDNYMIRVSSR